MSNQRRAGTYRSYGYLADGVHSRYQLASEVRRVPDATVTWADDVDVKARELVRDSIVASFHDHLSVRPVDPEYFLPYRRSGREVTPFEGLAASELDLVFDGGHAYVTMIRAHAPWDWDDLLAGIAMRLCDWAHQDFVRPVTRLDDIDRVKEDGAVGVVLTVEAGDPVGNDLDRLDILFGLGVRLIGLVYNENNLLGGGLGDKGECGLSALGELFIQRMNQLGMVVDLSHCNDRTSLEATASSDAPVVITHAGARALWDIPRMKPDDVLRACAESGGVVGIEAAPHTTMVRGRRHDLESVMAHVEYCIELLGADHVALGPDTHYGDHVAWHRYFKQTFGRMSAGAPPYQEVEYVVGCENPTDGVSNMVRWMIAHGYPDDCIRKVMGANVLRVLHAVWPQ